MFVKSDFYLIFLWLALAVTVVFAATHKSSDILPPHHEKSDVDHAVYQTVPWPIVTRCKTYCYHMHQLPLEVSVLDCTCTGGEWVRMQ